MAAASVPQQRERQAGCLPPFIGQSGQSGQSVAPAAEREEPNGPSSEAAPPPYNTYTTLGRNTLPLKTEAQHTYVASVNKAAATKKLNNINVKGRKGKMLNGIGQGKREPVYLNPSGARDSASAITLSTPRMFLTLKL